MFFRMKRVTIIELNKDFEIPESWQELTDKQVRFVFREYCAARRHKDMGVFWGRMLDCFLLAPLSPPKGGRWLATGSRRAKRWSPYSKELAEVLFSFLFRVTGKGLEIDFTETKNFLPKLKIGCPDFVGPKDNLSGITFEEFEKANMYLNEYFGGDAESIYHFVACLYRPEGEKFDEDLIEKNAALIKSSCKEAWKLEMIMLWYCNCSRQIHTEDIYYNGNIVNFSVLFKNPEGNDDQPETKNNLGWLPILSNFAEKGIFGNLEQTRKADLYDLLALMLNKHQENKRHEDELKKIRNKH